jgi:predicted ATPase
LRTKADRLYTWTGTNPVDVGDDGGNTVSAILAANSQERKYNFENKQKLKPFNEVIAIMLKEMNLIEDFKVEKIAEERQEYEVKVKTKSSSVWADIPDVGFGISQVLPVLVQLFYAPDHATILMEQPELHLHPSAQAALADVMIYALKARENAQTRNIQLIIETHSEHFLRRLQRRIAEKSIENDKISAYFANTNGTNVKLDPLAIDLFGNISNWPDGFFGDMDEDILLQAEASLRRKLYD